MTLGSCDAENSAMFIIACAPGNTSLARVLRPDALGGHISDAAADHNAHRVSGRRSRSARPWRSP
jgi:hypothetical protein